MVRMIHRRERLVYLIGLMKKSQGIPVLDRKREKEVLSIARNEAKRIGANEKLVIDVISTLIKHGREDQRRLRSFEF